VPPLFVSLPERVKATSATEETRHAAKNRLFFFIVLSFFIVMIPLIKCYTISKKRGKKKAPEGALILFL